MLPSAFLVTVHGEPATGASTTRHDTTRPGRARTSGREKRPRHQETSRRGSMARHLSRGSCYVPRVVRREEARKI